eukprot:750463-Hanusia_phi.AAC.2
MLTCASFNCDSSGVWCNVSIWDAFERGRLKLFQMFSDRSSRFHDFRPSAISKQEGMGEGSRDSPRKAPSEVTSAAGEWIKKGSPNKNSTRPLVPKDALVQEESERAKKTSKSTSDEHEVPFDPELPKVQWLFTKLEA